MSVTPEVLANMQNSLSQLFAKDLINQWNRSTVLLGKIPAEAGFGKNIAWDVGFTGATANAYTEGANVVTGEYSVDSFQPATLAWGHYRSVFWVSDTEYDAAAGSDRSGEGLIRLLKTRLMGASQIVASTCNKDAFFGTGTATSGNFIGAPNIVGLLGGPLESTGVYANVNRSSFPEWQGNVLSNAGVARPLTFDLISLLENTIYTASYERPDLIIVDPGTFRKYQGLFEPIRRIEGKEATSYDSSTTDLFWQGIPVFRDKDLVAPSSSANFGMGTMLMLKKEYVKTVYLPWSDMSNQDVFKSMVDMGAGGSGMQSTPIGTPFRTVPLARQGDSSQFMCYVRLNIKVERPNACGYINNISIV